MVSGTITDQSGRTLSGQTVEAFLNSISHIPLLSVGFNCGFRGTSVMRPYIKELSEKSSFYVRKAIQMQDFLMRWENMMRLLK